MKHTLLLATLTLCGTFAFAQAEPDEAELIEAEAPVQDMSVAEMDAEDLTVDSTGEVFTDEGLSATERLRIFVEDEKGWSYGTNTKDDGSGFVVVKGVGTIDEPPNSKDYNESRVTAFDKAMLAAKASLAEQLEVMVKTSACYRTAEYPEPEEDTPEEAMAAAMAAMPDTSVCGKLVALTHGALDKALEKVGSDLNDRAASAEEKLAAAKEAMEQVALDESFSKSIGLAATSAVSGLQAFYTVEADGEIGVVAIWSPVLAETAATMLTGKVTKAGKGKKPITQQIPRDTKELLSTFGVQQKIDEKGNLVLVSYGQASARTSSKRAAKNAYDKAYMEALGAIRSFAGEIVSTSGNRDRAQSVTEYNDESMAPDISSFQAYERYQKSVADAMPINGAQTAGNWEAVHPVSGQKVYGTVVTWSSANAKRARQTKKAIEATAKAGAAGKRSIVDENKPAGAKKRSARRAPAAKPTVAEKDYFGSGSSGDDDAF